MGSDNADKSGAVQEPVGSGACDVARTAPVVLGLHHDGVARDDCPISCFPPLDPEHDAIPVLLAARPNGAGQRSGDPDDDRLICADNDGLKRRTVDAAKREYRSVAVVGAGNYEKEQGHDPRDHCRRATTPYAVRHASPNPASNEQ